MVEKFTELKALITTYEEQRRAAERKKKEAEIILSYLRAALSDLRELDGEQESGTVRAKAVQVQSEPSVDEIVEEEEEDKVETSSVPNGGREKASISALLGGNGQTWDRPE